MSRRPVQAALCGLAFALLAPAAPAITLAQLRGRLVSESRRLGPAAGVFVRDLGSGRTLFSRHGDVARSPASNEKLLTTSTALLRFGPDFQLRTRLVAAAAPVDGVVDGDVALVGAGDPYLSRTSLRLIASQLGALGVTRVRGRVLGDGSLLDGRVGSYDSGWAYDSDLGGRLGGLVIDEGRGADPALHAAAVLRSVLRAAGITVVGPARDGSLGTDGVELAGALSPPLGSLAKLINVPSDNFAAELLLKDLGADFGSAGSTTAGAAVVRSTLAGIGVRPARVVDGSGLSRADRVSPRQLVDLLGAMTTRAGAVLRSTLPVAGRSGTLHDRMRGTPAQDACQAKTGTLRDVSALSGYCAVAGGDVVAFSLLENRVCGACVKRVEDRIVVNIARYVPGSSAPPSTGTGGTAA